MKNNDIRQNAKIAHIKLWQIAEELGVTDSTFSRMLRKELSIEEKGNINSIILMLKQEDCTNDR